MSRLRKHHISFKLAFEGLKWAFRTQPNFAIHTFFALAALVVGWYVQLATLEWAFLVFVIFWVFVAELTNTALEAVVDLVTSEWRVQAKTAKDVAAAMVLTVSTGAVITGLILLGPKLITKLFL